MSRGILQLAATGKLRLQLEYRVLPTPLQSMGEEASSEKNSGNDIAQTALRDNRMSADLGWQ
ncbi:MAG TPA: hypothetical protein VHR84_21690 [Terriglobales bacterium]|jgi:hypothetical protein|nr:hypothetical protein [Terriglobales bacterium]